MKQTTRRKILYLGVIVLWLFLIFFFGKEPNKETGRNKWIVVPNGIEYFKKGLDVAGGTRLVYTIDYSQYKEVYTDAAQFQQVKKNIETIIKKNVDSRIDKLGVSEYNAYYQTAWDAYYLVVEIGGISDLDQAKNTIGKTLELEFKLPSGEEPNAQMIAERKELARVALNKVLDQPDKFQELMDEKGSENIFYSSYSGTTLSQLPDIYKTNADVLQNLEIGKIYPGLLEGIYATIPAQGSGEDTELKGFTFFRILSRELVERSKLSPQDIMGLAQQYELENTIALIKNPELALEEYAYDTANKRLTYFAAETNQEEVYKLEIYNVAKANQLGLTPEQMTAEDAIFDNTVEEVKSALVANHDPSEIEGTTFVMNDWTDITIMQEQIPSFAGQEVGTTEVYTHPGGVWVVKAVDLKTKDDVLGQMILLDNLDETTWNKIHSELKATTFYTIEDVFVQDRQMWVPAVDSKTNKLLNGAYFEFANTDLSQTGQPVVVINFNGKGKELFCNITKANIGTPMAIFAGGNMLTSPVINSEICGGQAEISGNFDSEWAKKLVESLNEWTMPATLVLMQEEKISPTLGENALNASMLAGAIGILLIIVLIWFMYGWRKAIVTTGVLLTFVIALLGLMKLTSYPLSLSGIAAVILSIGMGVDANILIYERVREEAKAGMTIKSAIDTWHKRSWAAIRDGNFSTLIIAALLFILGINMFKGFGLMMMLNIGLILALNVPMTKDLLHMVFHRKTDFMKKSRMDKKLK